ncbi:quinone oxidoreductase family protein [Nicoliella lavandulae]|uniref:NAD(P)-dependent alcohol dehydrogenase n=1 Tax=Nicoliella lavandulae TaxID=3082954 RepID=A0ABU8SIW9_9LACO
MKGIVYTKSGQLDGVKMNQVNKPVPAEDQVLVRVKSSSINFLDYVPFEKHFTKGRRLIGPRLSFKRFLDSGINNVMGCDFAGIVEAVGKQVQDIEVGDKIFGITNDFHFGAWAEYVCVNESQLAFTPSNLGFKECAALPMAAGTAVSLVTGAKVSVNQQVLLVGATGGVGLYALQLAKSLGAEVTVVSRPAGFKTVQKFGADHVIEARENWAKGVTTKFDSIIILNGRRSLGAMRRLLTPNGYYVEVHQNKTEISKNPFGDMMETGVRWNRGHFERLIVRPDWLWKVANLAQRQSIRPYIEQTFSINDVQSAIKYAIQNHLNGKVALMMDFDGEYNEER